MRRPIFLALFLFALAVQLKAQGIRGEIRDMEGEPVPFAAIFIKELTRGTTCNMLGSFSLPLPEGTPTFGYHSAKEEGVRLSTTIEAWGR